MRLLCLAKRTKNRSLHYALGRNWGNTEEPSGAARHRQPVYCHLHCRLSSGASTGECFIAFPCRFCPRSFGCPPLCWRPDLQDSTFASPQPLYIALCLLIINGGPASTTLPRHFTSMSHCIALAVILVPQWEMESWFIFKSIDIPYRVEILWYKPWRPKCFFPLEIIINVL